MNRCWTRPADPTPFEIAIESARIRLGWSDADYRHRAGASRGFRSKPALGRVEKLRLLLDALRRQRLTEQ